MVDFNNIMAIKYVLTDQVINNFPINCLKINVFAKIEEKLYKEYPDFWETIIFISNY